MEYIKANLDKTVIVQLYDDAGALISTPVYVLARLEHPGDGSDGYFATTTPTWASGIPGTPPQTTHLGLGIHSYVLPAALTTGRTSDGTHVSISFADDTTIGNVTSVGPTIVMPILAGPPVDSPSIGWAPRYDDAAGSEIVGAKVWLRRRGATVTTGLTGASISFRNEAGAELGGAPVTVGAIADAHGALTLTLSEAVPTDNAHSARITVTDAEGTIEQTHGIAIA